MQRDEYLPDACHDATFDCRTGAGVTEMIWVFLLINLAQPETVVATDLSRAQCEAMLLDHYAERGFKDGVPNCEERG